MLNYVKHNYCYQNMLSLLLWHTEVKRDQGHLADQGQVLGLAGQLLLIDCNLTCSMSQQ